MLRSDDQKQISRPIVRIATIGIAVGIALMMLSVAIVKGFQKEVRQMVIGFGSHFQVVSNRDNISKDSQRLEFSQAVYDSLKKVQDVSHVQIFATKPGIIESKEGLQGVVIKGVGDDYDWKFLQSVLTEGEVWPKDSAKADVVIISTHIANRLKLKLHDKVSVYFVNDQNDARQRNFRIIGLYNTGLEDYDAQYIITPISHVQKLSGWGLEAQLLVDTVSQFGMIPVGALAFGGDGNFRYNWSIPGWTDEGPHYIQTSRDTSFYVVVRDMSGTASDTAFATIDFDEIKNDDSFIVKTRTSGGSQSKYIGGYEVLINDYQKLLEADDRIFKSLPYDLQTHKVTDRSPEIFSWLAMLDINVIIIIVLMIVISIVNMTSALLIIILERQQMIGTLKALGSPDRPIVRIFLINSAFIIGRGILYGNIIGIGIAALQWKFKFIPLNPENYYVSTVPISLEWSWFLMLDAFTIIICLIAMMVPAKYVSRISPIRSIRFN